MTRCDPPELIALTAIRTLPAGIQRALLAEIRRDRAGKGDTLQALVTLASLVPWFERASLYELEWLLDTAASQPLTRTKATCTFCGLTRGEA
jgi:hypothetical protein